MPIYDIQDGVRRAKAAFEQGEHSILACVYGDGHNGAIMSLPIAELRSPKRAIDTTSTRSAMARWQRVKSATRQSPSPLPPIIVIVSQNSRGTPIRDVDVV